MHKIIVIGEILVEIMADQIGNGFREPIALTGPFPSGAPAIYIDQVARMGAPAAIIATVGDDDFGRVNLDRLRADGVDVSGVEIHPDLPTGSAFVRYRADGARDFVYNIRHSACGQLPRGPRVEALIARAGHLHVMGSSLSSPEVIAFNLEVARRIKGQGGTISFDPNLRKELLGAPGMQAAMREVLAMTDLYLPSGDELTLLTAARAPDLAVAELLGLGIRTIVHKRGAAGASLHDASGRIDVAGFDVEEIDPTGAGDCFGGAFTALWLQGVAPAEALRLAAAAGACAVTARGPMEGARWRAELEAFIAAAEVFA